MLRVMNLLCMVAKRLRDLLHSSDLVARLWGDEFVVILNKVDDELVQRMAQKLLAAISDPFMIEGRELILSTSIGISLYPKDGKSSEMLLRNADVAMYQAKKSGANQFKFYTEKLNGIGISF